ncbi:MAG: N(4)-(beta-N-acetylglucosaminyl)-L-asparaginase [Phycisphaerales bacterium]|nr:N(4)-(beta-N-acetylglucosaminyl)-L-asparaginase [Phycisphaerales bacterium]
MTVPLILSTWSFGQRGNEAAWPGLARGGHSIDAVERVCQVLEADQEVDSVGFGGLPDSNGHVSLDGCIMLAPNRCGSVCNVRRFMHPVSIARQVMEKTNHVMLAGDGADAFAQAQGFMPADLLAADAQDAYHRWLKERGQVDQTRDRGYSAPRPIDRGASRGQPNDGARAGRLFFHPAPEPPPGRSRDDESKWKGHDTIGVLCIDAHGVLAGACSTSGMPFKLPGRVGDSPIIGHGLYVDPEHGAAVATGTGELIMGVCGSFLAVELMRAGQEPLEAARSVLQRIIDNYDVKPEHQVALIAMRPDGQFASAALRSGYKSSVRGNQRNEVVEPDAVMLR